MKTPEETLSTGGLTLQMEDDDRDRGDEIIQAAFAYYTYVTVGMVWVG